MLVIAQKNMPSNKGKEVALVASSSLAGKSKKRKVSKKKKPQVPGPSKKIANQKGKIKAGQGKVFPLPEGWALKKELPRASSMSKR